MIKKIREFLAWPFVAIATAFIFAALGACYIATIISGDFDKFNKHFKSKKEEK